MIYEGSTVSLLAAENETFNVASEDVLTPMKKMTASLSSREGSHP